MVAHGQPPCYVSKNRLIPARLRRGRPIGPVSRQFGCATQEEHFGVDELCVSDYRTLPLNPVVRVAMLVCPTVASSCVGQLEQFGWMEAQRLAIGQSLLCTGERQGRCTPLACQGIVFSQRRTWNERLLLLLVSPSSDNVNVKIRHVVVQH